MIALLNVLQDISERLRVIVSEGDSVFGQAVFHTILHTGMDEIVVYNDITRSWDAGKDRNVGIVCESQL